MDELKQTSFHNHLRIGHALLTCGLFVFIFLSLILSVVPPTPARAFGTATLHSLTNSQRTANNVNALNTSYQLTNAAQAKAEDMVRDGYFDHTAVNGTTGWDYITKTGYTYESAGENLAASNEDDSAVVNGWLNSPSHRANLLNSSFTEVGYGIAYVGNFQNFSNVYFIVALYAKPTVTSTNNSSTIASNATDDDAEVSRSPATASAQSVDPAPTVQQPNTEQYSKEQSETKETTPKSKSSGLKQLVNNQSVRDSRISFGLLSLGTTLSVSGIAIESRRLFFSPKQRSRKYNNT